MNKDISKLFAARLKKLREENKLSQRALSGMIGAGTSAVYYWESNLRVPDINSLHNLCKILQVSADYLVGLKDVE